MLSRSLLARSSPLGLSRACSRSLSSLRLARPARCAVPAYTNLRQFSAAPVFRTENRADSPTPREPSGTCYIANIPYKVTAEQLKDAFSEFGKVESVRLLTSGAGLSRGIGFVQFESVAEAVSLVEAHEADPMFVLDRQIHVEHAQRTRNAPGSVEPSNTLMVLNIQGESEAEIRTMFGSFSDRILAVRFYQKEADLASRKAFIQFRNVDIATEAKDAFKNENGNTRIMYARQRQPPANSYSLTSRLSQHREK